MFESEVGFSVSFTRQCCGIGSGGGGGAAGAPARPRPRPAAAAGGGPPAGGGCGGGTNTPAGTTSADITIVCGVPIVRTLSQFVDVPAASNKANASISASSRANSTNSICSFGRDGQRRGRRTRGDIGGDRDEIVFGEVCNDQLHQLGLRA